MVRRSLARLGCKTGDEFLKTRIAAQRIPERDAGEVLRSDNIGACRISSKFQLFDRKVLLLRRRRRSGQEFLDNWHRWLAFLVTGRSSWRGDLHGWLVFPSQSGVDKAERTQWRSVVWLLRYLLFGLNTSRSEAFLAVDLVASRAAPLNPQTTPPEPTHRRKLVFKSVAALGSRIWITFAEGKPRTTHSAQIGVSGSFLINSSKISCKGFVLARH